MVTGLFPDGRRLRTRKVNHSRIDWRRVRFTPILEGDSVPSALAPSSEGVFPLPSFTRGAIVEIEIAAKSVTEVKGDSVVIFKKGDVAKK